MSFLTFPPQAATTASTAKPTVAITAVAPRYDPVAKDIVIGPDGEVVLGNPFESMADEVLMGILVRRGAYPEFATDFGNVFSLDAQQPTPSLQQAAIKADLQSQLPYRGDPTILSVSQFVFTPGPSGTLSVSFVITPAVGPTVPVQIPYVKKGS